MAFASTLDEKIPLRDGHGANKGPLYLAIGTFTSSGGGTGGEIDTEGDTVLYASAMVETATPADMQVELNTATAGKITLTTSADKVGSWMAVCKGYA